MRRIHAEPRPQWRQDVEELGFTYHTIDGEPYWDEAGWYEFSMSEIEELELATNRLHEMCLKAVQVVIDDDRFDEFQIPRHFGTGFVPAGTMTNQPCTGGLIWPGMVDPLPKCSNTTPTRQRDYSRLPSSSGIGWKRFIPVATSSTVFMNA